MTRPHEPRIIDAVRRMKADGALNFDIGLAVGLSEKQVIQLCHRRKIKRGEGGNSEGRMDIALGVRLVEQYQAEAARRGLRFTPFMRQLLLTIARDNLFVAILGK